MNDNQQNLDAAEELIDKMIDLVQNLPDNSEIKPMLVRATFAWIRIYDRLAMKGLHLNG